MSVDGHFLLSDASVGNEPAKTLNPARACGCSRCTFSFAPLCRQRAAPGGRSKKNRCRQRRGPIPGSQSSATGPLFSPRAGREGKARLVQFIWITKRQRARRPPPSLLSQKPARGITRAKGNQKSGRGGRRGKSGGTTGGRRNEFKNPRAGDHGTDPNVGLWLLPRPDRGRL